MDRYSTSKRWLNSVKPKELADLYREAIKLGCTCYVTKGTHVRVMLPEGGSANGPLTGGARADKQMRTRLRRAGLAV